MNGMFGIDCSSPSATGHFVGSDVGFHPTLYCLSPSETVTHVSATAETASKLRQMNVAVRTLDGIVKNKYTNNPGTVVSFGTTLADFYRQNRAAWISASHVEKAPKKKDPPTP